MGNKSSFKGELLVDMLSCVASRVRNRVDSLDAVFRFKRSGIEGWFKVELAYVLGDCIVSLNNKGPDITLSDGTKIEIKAATDFDASYLCGGALKDKVPCLFLGSGENERSVCRLKSMTSVQVVGLEYIEGKHRWIIGCIVPANPYQVEEIVPVEHKERVMKTAAHPDDSSIVRPSYSNFNELRTHLERAPANRITICMDKHLLNGGTLDELRLKAEDDNDRLGSNDFRTIGRINYRRGI